MLCVLFYPAKMGVRATTVQRAIVLFFGFFFLDTDGCQLQDTYVLKKGFYTCTSLDLSFIDATFTNISVRLYVRLMQH